MYLRPTAAIAPDAILPGDPKRAMDIAVRVTQKPLMANHARGLWGYTGTTRAGMELTVQATGVGGASTAAVVSDLAELGVQRAIRIGTCAATAGGPAPGESIVVAAVHAADGVGMRHAGGEDLRPDPGLMSELARATGDHAGRVASAEPLVPTPALASDVVAVDLSTAAFLAVAGKLGIRAACVLVVAAGADGTRLSDGDVDAASLRLGEDAASVLASLQPAAEPSSAA